jgi:hypothetical protein
MQDELNRLDWVKLGNAGIPALFREAESENEEVRRKALGKLRDTVAPWELLDGYSSSTKLIRMSESRIPEAVIPFLIELLKAKNSKDKSYILEILYELSRYIYVDESSIPAEKRESYGAWANRLESAVRQELGFYETLLNSEALEVQQAAKDLIKLLTAHKGFLE